MLKPSPPPDIETPHRPTADSSERIFFRKNVHVQRTDFYYELPEELIAQRPADRRDGSRLLVLYRQTKEVIHKSFTDFVDIPAPGDLLILNNSKVIPARLYATKPDTGGNAELLLLEELTTNEWWCMLKPGKRLREGSRIQILDRNKDPTPINGELLGKNLEGHGRVRFSGTPNILENLGELGETPLPPYINRDSGLSDSDPERYQTVFAHPPGSVAAPTAGLHFTPQILGALRGRGVNIAEVTLHVSLGTFAPVKAEAVEDHQMHHERYAMSANTAQAINETKAAGGRVYAIGTTSVRVLETIGHDLADGDPIPEEDHTGKTNIFIHPPAKFRLVDHLLTNFHLPESTLLMLISALASPGEMDGRETIMNTYEQAIAERYRFFSYGDAMLIL